MSGCAGSCCSSKPICPCRFDQNPEVSSLSLIVACFQQRQAGLYAEQAYYASLSSLHDAVVDAVQALDEENGLRPNRPALTLPQIYDLQQKLVTAIDKLADTREFSDLYAQIVAASGGIDLPETVFYDTALRIALYTGRLPEKVKIHADNLQAITALSDTLNDKDWLDCTKLPLPLQQLSATEIELCLSICRDKICGLRLQIET